MSRSRRCRGSDRWSSLPDNVVSRIIGKLASEPSSVAALRSACKATQGSVCQHWEQLNARLSDTELLASTKAFPSITALEFKYGSAVTDLSAIQYFSRLQKLNLSNLRQAQAFEKSRVFGRFPASIRVLILAFSDVRTRNLEAMQLSQLHHLALNFCTKLHWPSLRKLLPQMISLKILTMDAHGKSGDNSFWEAISGLPLLELNLSGPDFKTALRPEQCPRALQRIEFRVACPSAAWLASLLTNLPQLQSLRLVSVKDEATEGVGSAARSLRELHVESRYNEGLCDAAVRAIGTLTQLTRLEVVGCKHWGPVDCWQRLLLKELVMRDCTPDMGRNMYEDIIAPGALRQLVTLKIHGNPWFPRDVELAGLGMSQERLRMASEALQQLPRLATLSGRSHIIDHVAERYPGSWECTSIEPVHAGFSCPNPVCPYCKMKTYFRKRTT